MIRIRHYLSWLVLTTNNVSSGSLYFMWSYIPLIVIYYILVVCYELMKYLRNCVRLFRSTYKFLLLHSPLYWLVLHLAGNVLKLYDTGIVIYRFDLFIYLGSLPQWIYYHLRSTGNCPEFFAFVHISNVMFHKRNMHVWTSKLLRCLQKSPTFEEKIEQVLFT